VKPADLALGTFRRGGWRRAIGRYGVKISCEHASLGAATSDLT
jgi:hypothetical protein